LEHFEGEFVGSGGTRLYYQRWRPEQQAKATLAVVHGFNEYSGRYGNVVDWFVPRGYAVHAFDHRGHGRSQGQRGAIEYFAQVREDVQAFLALVRQEEPVLPLFLLGHSYGGLVALNYVLHQPDGLVGVIASGPLLSQPGISPIRIQASKLLAKVWPDLSVGVGLDATALSRDKAVVEAYVNDPLVHGKGTPRTGIELMAAMDWTQAHAADLTLPCLIVHGGADRICPTEASQRFFENVTFADKERIEYEGYYHELFNEVGKEQVLADVEAWLERHLELP
jgi:alpha-beta hydrolase superfamily lysophospholipase